MGAKKTKTVSNFKHFGKGWKKWEKVNTLDFQAMHNKKIVRFI